MYTPSFAIVAYAAAISNGDIPIVAPPNTSDKFSSLCSSFSFSVTNVDIPNFFKNATELLGPTSAIILTLIVFAENSIPFLTVTSP